MTYTEPKLSIPVVVNGWLSVSRKFVNGGEGGYWYDWSDFQYLSIRHILAKF